MRNNYLASSCTLQRLSSEHWFFILFYFMLKYAISIHEIKPFLIMTFLNNYNSIIIIYNIKLLYVYIGVIVIIVIYSKSHQILYFITVICEVVSWTTYQIIHIIMQQHQSKWHSQNTIQLNQHTKSRSSIKNWVSVCSLHIFLNTHISLSLY